MKINKQRMNKGNYDVIWENIIEAEGYDSDEGKVLQCGDICFMYDLTISGKKISDIVLLPNYEIRFYYDKEHKEYTLMDNFRFSDLKKFYNAFVDAWNAEEETFEFENQGEGFQP